MPASVDDWSDQHWDRSFARQSAQVDNVKLLVTFTLAFAGTMVATALQVTPQNRLDLWATIALGLGLLLAITVILLDRLKWPSRQKMLQRQTDMNWTDDELLAYIRLVTRDVHKENDGLVSLIQRIARYQLLLSGVASALAAVSLLRVAA